MDWVMNGDFCAAPGQALQCQKSAAALRPFVHEHCAEMAVVRPHLVHVKAGAIVLR